MYSNEKKGFSILDIIVKIILFGLFIFILVWLFNKKVPNMAPFYSNVFRENIKYMQEAGENYFTDDKMPKEVGQQVKMTLSQMIDAKLIIPFVDEDGNSCDIYNSYVTITKQEDESYILKTNLKCNKEEDYTIKILGCHTYCKDKTCEKKCYKEQLTSYQYKKQVTNTTTKYSCKNGYSLNGKYCYKTFVSDTYDAKVTVTDTKTYTEDALTKVTGGSKTELDVIVESNKSYVDRISKTNKEYTDKITGTKKEYTDAKTNTTSSTSKVYTNAIVTKTEDKKTCTQSGYTESYSCNCTGSWSGGQYHTVCSTCTRYVPTESCTTTPGKTTYSCPSGYKEEGSGSSLKCYKNVTTYSCPSGYKEEGSGSSLKCYTVKKTYSCPKEANVKVGSGSSLKCYKVVDGTISYYCKDSSYTLNGTKCTKTVKEETIKYNCEEGYKLEGTVCKKYTTDKVKADAKKVTNKSYKYTWSTNPSLSGWTKTGKTKTVTGKEICE